MRAILKWVFKFSNSVKPYIMADSEIIKEMNEKHG